MSACTTDPLPQCTEDEKSECLEVADKPNLRIKNGSSYDYCNVRVELDNQTIYYGNLESGESSCYIAAETLYRYAYVELAIEGKMFIVQPIDFIGETPLPQGKYTYIITVEDKNGNTYDVDLEFR